MTQQEIFDKVKNHLLTQNESAIVNQVCMYRAGCLKCAIGILIPDDKYNPRMEGLTVYALFDDFPEALPGITKEDVSFLRSLQRIYDKYPPSEWKTKLKSFAITCDLNY